MKARNLVAGIVWLAMAAGGTALAGTWATITIDGKFTDWNGISAVATDRKGDGGRGRDVRALYLANDSENLYVRIASYNSNRYDGNELVGIDGDNNPATGFNLFGAGIGADLLVAGSSMYGETTTNFNNGAANPSSVSWGPATSTRNVELAIPLSTVMPGNIPQAFPGGLGSTIKVIFGDSNRRAGDTVVAQYTLAVPPGSGGSTPPPSGSITYTESAGDVPNPERGVFRWGGDITDPNIDYAGFAAGGTRLVYTDIRLDNYTSSTIPTSYLDKITAGFNRIRSAGLKALVRIEYNDSEPQPNKPPKEASPTYLVQHLQQLQPIFEANKDVIAYFFAGIIGAWGEWHSTYYYADNNYAQYNLPTPYWRRWVIDQLLTYLPSDRFVLIRRPWWKDPAYGSEALWPGEQVTEETAFTTAGVARVGHHNDAFLSGPDDMDTYDSSNIEAQKDFLSRDTLYVPLGGETNEPNSPYITCSNALAEMQRLHWTFLHQDYHPSVISSWQSNGCWDEIKKRLGYRLVLTTATLPQKIVSGQPFVLSFTVTNTGWAPAYNKRTMYLVVTDGGNHALDTIPLTNVDIRRWKPGQTYTVSVSVTPTLPSPPPSSVNLALWLPDEALGLQNNPMYSLRFANDGVWNATMGWNELNSTPIPVQ